jgi:stage III sporulation protein AH
MLVLTVRKVNKTVLLMIGLLIAVLAISGIREYDRLEQQAKIDRSNAMQVSKPILTEQVVPVAGPDFFMEYRLERDKIRSERSDLLRESIKNAKTEEARQHAQDMVLKIVQEKQREAEMENLIKARGFTDALIFIRDNSVSAVIKNSSLSKEDVVQVADIISRVAGVKVEDITISAKP